MQFFATLISHVFAKEKLPSIIRGAIYYFKSALEDV